MLSIGLRLSPAEVSSPGGTACRLYGHAVTRPHLWEVVPHRDVLHARLSQNATLSGCQRKRTCQCGRAQCSYRNSRIALLSASGTSLMATVNTGLTNIAWLPVTGWVRITGCSARRKDLRRRVADQVVGAVVVRAPSWIAVRPDRNFASAPITRRMRRTCCKTACRRRWAGSSSGSGSIPSAARDRRTRRNATAPRQFVLSSRRRAPAGSPDDRRGLWCSGGSPVRRTSGRTGCVLVRVIVWSRKNSTWCAINASCTSWNC